MALPPEIFVEPESMSEFKAEDDRDIPPHTRLFRDNWRLEEVMGLVLEHLPESGIQRQLNILSVGSSYGAEADSVLAYLSKEAPHIGRVSLTGVDINPVVIKAAQEGKYQTNSRTAPPNRGVAKAIGAYMFATTRDRRQGGHYLIDSGALRAAHDVQFLLADLRKTEIGVPKADIILCNNLLYHLAPNEAEQLVWSMTNYLAKDGVMSFGSHSSKHGAHGFESKQYMAWRAGMAKKLGDVGVAPIVSEGNAGQLSPFIFRRQI